MTPAPRIHAPSMILALALALAASGRAGTAQARIEVGPDLGNDFLPFAFPVSLAVLEDGEFALSGTILLVPAGNPQASHAQFVVQTYLVDGRPSGSSFMPQLAANPPADNGGIGSLGDRYFVSWQRSQLQTSRATLLSRNGQVLAKPFGWPNSDIELYASYERYGHGPSWDFLPSFYYNGGINPIDGETLSQATVRAYSATAAPIGQPAVLGTGSGWVFIDDLAINGDGTFVVVSQRCATDFSSCAEGVEIFWPDGEPRVPFSTLGVPAGRIDGAIVIGVAQSGQFMLLWGEGKEGTSERLLARLFDDRAMPITDTFRVAQAPIPLSGFDPKIYRRGDDYVIAWTLIRDDTGAFDFYLSEFSSASHLLSEPTLIAHSYDLPEPSGSNNISAAGYTFEISDSGHGVVAWSTFDENYIFTGHLRLITVQGNDTRAPLLGAASPPGAGIPSGPTGGEKR